MSPTVKHFSYFEDDMKVRQWSSFYSEKFCVGTHLCVFHGKETLPAVVVSLLWNNFVPVPPRGRPKEGQLIKKLIFT